MRKRVFPVLLLREQDFVKSIKFENFIYVGDPLNVIKIFNEKFIDELVILNLTPGAFEDYAFLNDLFSEAFVPITYGGGLASLQEIQRVLDLGVERVVLNVEKFLNTDFVAHAVSNFGSSTICAKIDVDGHYQYATSYSQLDDRISWCIEQGVSEIIIQCIARDGTQIGLDSAIIGVAEKYSSRVSIVLSGGVGDIDSLPDRVFEEFSGVAASSLFVFAPGTRSVLINNPCVDYSEVYHGYDM